VRRGTAGRLAFAFFTGSLVNLAREARIALNELDHYR
jgi:hypothetical protein